MFRRITDRLGAAVGGDVSMEQNVRRLTALGFAENDVRRALRNAGGDVDRAAELLLASGPSVMATVDVNGTSGNGNNENDAALRNAIEASRQSEEQRCLKLAQEASIQQHKSKSRQPRPTRSAAVSRAAEAAASRAAINKSNAPPKRANNGGLSAHHPGVQLPKKLETKGKEEQILRCADRMKSHPTAVDTLLRALTTIRQNPQTEKYRRIDKQNAGYQRSLANVPGTEALLKSMNFLERGPHLLVLERYMVDDALLYLGISALENARLSSEYQNEKRKIQFEKEFRQIQALSDSSAEEAIKRADFISKCPAEPKLGGALMQVKIGSDLTIRRRFDGDDVLSDVLNWLGANGSVIPAKLASREWCLVDLNRYPGAPIDCENNQDKTLQYIGCWPSGKLEIRPSPEDWKERGMLDDSMGSSRGLGSAPTETLV